MSLVCSKLYRDFFYRINKTTYDMGEFVSWVRAAIGDIAKVYGLGRCTEQFSAPKTPFNINGVNNFVVFYENENGYDDRLESFKFVTGENGSLEVTFYPEKGRVWTQDELDELGFLAENLFILGGRVQMLSVMKRISITDIGTGAANMNGLSLYCEQLLSRNLLKNYDMIFMNLKNFKFVNRIIGEKNADMILKSYTQRLLSFVREDERVARPGGDNYCVLIRKERLEDFIRFIANVTFKSEGTAAEVAVNPRAGIYEIKENDTVNDAIDSAATALSTARITGRCDILWFEPEMLNRTIKANTISTMFPEAIKNEEFVVYYQPKVSLSDNQLCGCEALSRWVKDGKIVSPADFIPVLEREGTICKLDFYVLDKVCADIKRWLENGLKPVRVSTNFSKLHLHSKDFADEIISIINKHGVDPA